MGTAVGSGETEADGERAGAHAPRALRFRLFMLAASGLLPLAVAAALGIAYLVQNSRQAAQKSALELSRALATAVNSELKSTIAVLESMALSDDLAASRLALFQIQARQIALQRKWRGVVLADPHGTLVMNSNLAPGETIPPPRDPASLGLVTADSGPVVGRAVAGSTGSRSFAVRVPVLRGGKLVYVLSAVVTADQILDVLTRQNIPSTWVASVFDKSGSRVARTKTNTSFSAAPSSSLQALLDAGGPEGVGRTRTLEGVSNFAGFTRLQDSGWVVTVGISTREVYLSLLPVLVTLFVGLLASLGLSAYLAFVLGKRVSQPIHKLANAADALGRGNSVSLPTLEIVELNEVGKALNRASLERETALLESREAHAERDALLQRLTQALRLAEEAGRSKDEFLAVLGHELRNPLAPISNALQLLDMRADEGTRAEREVLRRQLNHMVRLVDDLLDVSRIRHKQISIRLQPLRIANVLNGAVEAVRPLLVDRALAVDVQPAAASAWVQGDETRLTQALNNILGNAVKFTFPNGRIEIRMFAKGNEVSIEIRDDGLGMPDSVLEHAFDAFFQAPQAIDRARGGLGLGLAIVKSVIEAHGGRVGANSEGPGHGTTITVALPCIEAPVFEEPAKSAAPLITGKGKVLVVDDNQDAADTVGMVLEIAGYEVRVVYHPAAALEMQPHFKADACVLDIGLPGMSGYELAAALRGAPHFFSGALVALTGYGEEHDRAAALRAGFDAHLTKPAESAALLQLLASLLGVRDGRADVVT